MAEDHVERHVVRDMVVDMFPRLPSDVVLARFDSYSGPPAVNDIIDDLMAYSIGSEDSAPREIVIEPCDNDDGIDDADDDYLQRKNELALKAMFPDFDSERLHRIFVEILGGDFEQAISILVELAGDDVSNYPEEVRVLSDLCPLVPVSVLHGALVERNFLLDDVIRDIFSETDDVAQFGPKTKLNMADHLKFTAFKRMFPHSSEEIIFEVMKSEDYIYLRCLEALTAIFGSPAVKSDATVSVDLAQDRCLIQQLPHLPREDNGMTSVTDRLDGLYRGDCDIVTEEALKEKEIEIVILSEQRSKLRRRAQSAIANRQNVHSQMLYEKARELDDLISTAREQLMVSLFISA